MDALCSRRYLSETVREAEIPADLLSLAEQRRAELIEALAEHDEIIGEQYIMEERPSPQELAVPFLVP